MTSLDKNKVYVIAKKFLMTPEILTTIGCVITTIRTMPFSVRRNSQAFNHSAEYYYILIIKLNMTLMTLMTGLVIPRVLTVIANDYFHDINDKQVCIVRLDSVQCGIGWVLGEIL